MLSERKLPGRKLSWVFAATLVSGFANTGLAASSDEAEAPVAQSFPPELVEAGRERFVADCGFCHGRDATGGSRGLDLTRSELVAEDIAGNLIGRVVRSGRIDKGMPAFATLGNDEILAISAFVHTQKAIADSADGGRRSVEPEDVAVGNAEQGQRYFQVNCSSCHSASGDLAGIGSRLEGLPLMREMLYPSASGRNSATLSVTTQDGERYSGTLAYRDEFTVAMRDENDAWRSWTTRNITFTVDDPREAHVEQLARYTDEDMHNVLAFLQSLR